MSSHLEEFFNKTGKEEYLLFKNLFSLEKEKFAVIKISGALFEEHGDLIADNIAYLNKIGLFPIIVHGAGSSLDKKLPSSTKVNGLRVTKKEDVPIIVQTFGEIASELSNKINSAGGSSTIVGDLFECDKVSGLGEVGEVTTVYSEKLVDSIKQGASPIISPIGACENSTVNINADSVGKAICKSIKPKKYILLTSTGGVLDASGNLVSFLNLGDDSSFSNLSGGMLLKAKEAKSVLEECPKTEVVITSPKDLLYELFTIKGKGTILKNHELVWENNLSGLAKGKVKEIIESSFGKELVSNYFEANIVDVLYEKNLEGLAVVQKEGDFFYLDKFAVQKYAQGNGIGKSLWNELIKKYPSFFWRASLTNPINDFYKKNCDGLTKAGNWNLYWKGIDCEKIKHLSDIVVSKKSSFKAVVK